MAGGKRKKGWEKVTKNKDGGKTVETEGGTAQYTPSGSMATWSPKKKKKKGVDRKPF